MISFKKGLIISSLTAILSASATQGENLQPIAWIKNHSLFSSMPFHNNYIGKKPAQLNYVQMGETRGLCKKAFCIGDCNKIEAISAGENLSGQLGNWCTILIFNKISGSVTAPAWNSSSQSPVASLSSGVCSVGDKLYRRNSSGVLVTSFLTKIGKLVLVDIIGKVPTIEIKLCRENESV